MSKKCKIVLILIMVIQVCTYVYYGSIKTNMFEDELYSLGYAKRCTGVSEWCTYFTDSFRWSYNEWKSVDSLEDMYTITSAESVFTAGFPIKYFLLNKGYEPILNTLSSISTSPQQAYWIYLIFNSVMVILTEIIIVWLLNRLEVRDTGICFAVLSYGLALDMISIACYIRFYAWTLFLISCYVMLNYCIYNATTWIRSMTLALVSALVIVLAMGNTTLATVICASMLLLSTIVLYFQQKWKTAISQSIVILGGLVYCGFNTNLIDVIINMGDYANAKAVSEESLLYRFTNNLLSANYQTVMAYIRWIFKYFADYRVVSTWIISIVIVAMSVLCIIYVCKKDKSEIKSWRNVFVVVAAVILGCCVGTDYHLLPAILLYTLSIIVFVVEHRLILGKALKDRQIMYMAIISATYVIYSAFCALTNMNRARYYALSSILVCIIFWYVVDYLLNDKHMCFNTKTLSIVVAASTIIILLYNIVLNRNVDFIYEKDKDSLDRIHSYSDIDTLLICDDAYLKTIYDCVYNVGDGTNVYPLLSEGENRDYSAIDTIDRNQMLLWTWDGEVSDVLFNRLNANNYDYYYIGATYCSKVYYVSKK